MAYTTTSDLVMTDAQRKAARMVALMGYRYNRGDADRDGTVYLSAEHTLLTGKKITTEIAVIRPNGAVKMGDVA